MIKKEEVISFVWQHILLLVSLYVMTFGVAACVRSQLGSSVISTIPYVMASAGKMLDYIPGWTIGGYTIMMNAIFVVLQILILRRNFEWVQLFQLAIGFIFGMFIDLNMVLTQWMVSENILVNALVRALKKVPNFKLHSLFLNFNSCPRSISSFKSEILFWTGI